MKQRLIKAGKDLQDSQVQPSWRRVLPVLYKQENYSQLAGGQVVESQIQAE